MTSEQSEMMGEHPPFHRPSRTDVVYWGSGVGLTFLATGKDTNGAHTQVEDEVVPGGSTAPHIHHREDETWYVVEGSLEVRIGDSTLVVRPGDYIKTPRGTVHAFRNVGERTARMLVTFVPSGRDSSGRPRIECVSGVWARQVPTRMERRTQELRRPCAA